MHHGKFAEEIEVSSFVTTSSVDSALWHFLHSRATSVPFFAFTQHHTRRTEGVYSTSCANEVTSLSEKYLLTISSLCICIYIYILYSKTRAGGLGEQSGSGVIDSDLCQSRPVFISTSIQTVLMQAFRGVAQYLQKILFYSTLN